MTTKAEAQQLAGELLRLTAIGQALQSQHETRMEEAYNEVYARLQVLGLASWDTASMPDEITPWFVALMAHNKMDLVGVSDSLYQRIMVKVGDEGEKGVSMIRYLINQSYEDLSEPTDY